MNKDNNYWAIFILLMVGFLLAGCGGNSQSENANLVAPTETTITEDDLIREAQPVEAVGPGEYVFPDQFANVANPVPADEDSQTKGAGIYESSCERCHGVEGKGDGTSAVQNNLAIVDFSDEKIAALSDAELFYIISNGVADTPMEGWGIFNEELRWHLVNYIRVLQQN